MRFNPHYRGGVLHTIIIHWGPRIYSDPYYFDHKIPLTILHIHRVYLLYSRKVIKLFTGNRELQVRYIRVARSYPILSVLIHFS